MRQDFLLAQHEPDRLIPPPHFDEAPRYGRRQRRDDAQSGLTVRSWVLHGHGSHKGGAKSYPILVEIASRDSNKEQYQERSHIVMIPAEFYYQLPVTINKHEAS